MWSKPMNYLTTDGTGFLFCDDLISLMSVYIVCSWYVYVNVMMINQGLHVCEDVM